MCADSWKAAAINMYNINSVSPIKANIAQKTKNSGCTLNFMINAFSVF